MKDYYIERIFDNMIDDVKYLKVTTFQVNRK